MALSRRLRKGGFAGDVVPSEALTCRHPIVAAVWTALPADDDAETMAQRLLS